MGGNGLLDPSAGGGGGYGGGGYGGDGNSGGGGKSDRQISLETKEAWMYHYSN